TCTSTVDRCIATAYGLLSLRGIAVASHQLVTQTRGVPEYSLNHSVSTALMATLAEPGDGLGTPVTRREAEKRGHGGDHVVGHDRPSLREAATLARRLQERGQPGADHHVDHHCRRIQARGVE